MVMPQVRSCIAAIVVAVIVGLFPVGSAHSQGPTTGELVSATWNTVSQMNHRQIRQDRIIIFGFGVTALLLIGLTIVCFGRPVGPSPSQPAELDPGNGIMNTATQQNNLARSIGDRIARYQLNAKLTAIARRQKRIMNLISEMKASISDNMETSNRFRGALDKLLEEADRIDNEFKDTPGRMAGNAT
jgi:hypothetical protein